jgi:thioredoxin 1
MEKQVNFKDLIKGDKPVLVDFTATWCGPCRMMAPVLEDVKKRIGEKASIIKVDIDRNQAFANSMGISGVPTFVLFQHGKEQWRQVGMISGQQLMAVLERFGEKE